MENLGKIEKKDDGYQVTLERTFNHKVEKVWDAITNPDKIKIWFTDVKMDFKEGSRMTIIFQDEARTKSYGRIVTIRPPVLFEFIWEGEEGVPDEFAQWELFSEGPQKTRLVLTYSRVSEDYAPRVAAGWHVTIDYLEQTLNGKTEFPPFGGEPSEDDKAISKKYEKLFNENFKN